MFPIKTPPRKCEKIKIASSTSNAGFFTEFSVDNFNQELHDCLDDFLIRNASIDENNFDELFNNFHSIITQTIDKHAPLKKLTRKQQRLQRRPWITKGIVISIKR